MSKAPTTMRSTVLIWHMVCRSSHLRQVLVAFVIVLSTMTWRPTLRDEMPSTHLRTWASASATSAVFAKVVQSLWLLLLYQMSVLWVCITFPLWTNWWYKAWRALRTDSCIFNVTSSLIFNLYDSWFVLLFFNHLIIIPRLRLCHLITLSHILPKLLDPRRTATRSAHWVTLFVTRSLAIVPFLFNNELVLLSVSFLSVHL